MATGSVKIEVSKTDLRALKATMDGIKNGAERVLSRAVNKTLTGVRTDMVREGRMETTAKAKAIRDTIKIEKTTIGNLSGRVTSKGGRVNLAEYQARQVKAGVRFRIYKNKPLKTWGQAFIIKTKSGKRLVVQREYARDVPGAKKVVKGRAYAAMSRKYRYPLREVHGPPIPYILGQAHVFQRINASANDRLANNLSHETDYMLSRVP